VAHVGQAALTAFLVVVLGGSVLASLWDASVRPAEQFRAAGFHKPLWLALLVLTNIFTLPVYLISVRPRCERQRAPR